MFSFAQCSLFFLTISHCFILSTGVHIEPTPFSYPREKFVDGNIRYFQPGKSFPLKCKSNYNATDGLIVIYVDKGRGWEQQISGKGTPNITIDNLENTLPAMCCDESPNQSSPKDFNKCPKFTMDVAPKMWVHRPTEIHELDVTNITEGETLEFTCWGPNVSNLVIKMMVRGEFVNILRSNKITNSSGTYIKYNSSVDGSNYNTFKCQIEIDSQLKTENQLDLRASILKPTTTVSPTTTTNPPPVVPKGLSLTVKIIIGSAALVVFVLGFTITVVVCYRIQPKFSVLRSHSADDLLSPYVLLKPDDLVDVCVIDRGHFGVVHKCKWKINMEVYFVAKKELRNRGPNDIDELRRELDTLKKIPPHPNVLTLFAAVRNEMGVICIVTELCDTSLKKELHKIRKEVVENKKIKNEQRRQEQINEKVADLVCFSLQICRGMKHLHTRREHFGACVHRDLAARNVLIKDGIPVISDFGLSRHVTDPYYFISGGPIPAVCYGPECLDGFRDYDQTICGDSRYSTASDVWSFGILLYEMFSFGEDPVNAYRSQGANPQSPQSLLNFFENQNRLTRPTFCPEEVYEVMQNCWKYVTHDRPTFVELEETFNQLLPNFYNDRKMEEFKEKVENAEMEQAKWNEIIASLSRTARNEEAAKNSLRALEAEGADEHNRTASTNIEFPEVDFDEIQRMTRDFGLFQNNSQTVVADNDQYLRPDTRNK